MNSPPHGSNADLTDSVARSPFFIGPVEIKSRIILSPMAGFSDSPYRRICRKMGNSLSVTEFVSAEDIVYHESDQAAMRLFTFKEEERPVSFQLFGQDAATMARAVEKVLPYEPDIIDINVGCSVSRVTRRGCGAGLLRNLPALAAIIRSVKQVTDIPVTCKIRLGWDEQSINFTDTIDVAVSEGAAMVACHGRTRSQAYSGQADWGRLQQAAEYCSRAGVPFTANGDINSHQGALERLTLPGVSAVMVGRAARGNPWIFSGDRFEKFPFHEIVRLHLEFMIEFYGDRGYTLFRKHAVRYAALLDEGVQARVHERWSSLENMQQFEEGLKFINDSTQRQAG